MDDHDIDQPKVSVPLSSFVLIEEVKAARRISILGAGLSGVFLIISLILPLLTGGSYTHPSSLSNIIGTGALLAFNLLIIFLIRRKLYSWIMKYFIIGFHLTFITLTIAGYSRGVDLIHAARTISLNGYFIVIILSGLFQNPRVPLFTGALAALQYSCFFIAARLSGTPVYFEMETFRRNILSWDILIVNCLFYIGAGALIALIARRQKKLLENVRLSFLELTAERKERRRSEERAAFFQNYDRLTGLPNIRRFTRRLEEEVEKAQMRSHVFAVLCIGLDAFKNVNQIYGAEAGHRILKEAAERFKTAFRQDDYLCRFRGDQFLIFFSDIKKDYNVSDLVRKTLPVFEEPFDIGGETVKVCASGGFSVYPRDDDYASGLIEKAELAMFRAKEEEKGSFLLFDPDLQRDMDWRMRIEREMDHSLNRDEFFLVYQPKVDASGKIKGAEALLRWHSPALGRVGPDGFIPVAESSGLIVPLGYLAFRRCCEQISTWEAKGVPPVRITVNVSSVQFRQADFVDQIRTIVEETEVDPSWLGVEVTESGVMTHPEEIISKLQELKNLGLTISIDDFGKGYSSLSRLGNYPLDTLKIDKSFVEDLPGSENAACLVRVIIDLANNLNYSVVAEGVESSDQVVFLLKNGCLLFQGFYFYEPLSAEDFEELLQRKSEEVAE